MLIDDLLLILPVGSLDRSQHIKLALRKGD